MNVYGPQLGANLTVFDHALSDNHDLDDQSFWRDTNGDLVEVKDDWSLPR